MAHGNYHNSKIARRRAQAFNADLYAREYDTMSGNSDVCVCGRTRGEHDIAPDFTQPCVESGCKDFTLASTVDQQDARTPEG